MKQIQSTKLCYELVEKNDAKSSPNYDCKQKTLLIMRRMAPGEGVFASMTNQ